MDEVKNAVIISATIEQENGILGAWLHLDYGHDARQGFGGFALYLPKACAHHNIQSLAGHFIWRVMEIAGVETWKDLPGKAVRVRADYDRVTAIGHIIRDDWFNPSEDFKEAEEKK